MKKLLKYPFLCLLLVTMAAAAPFMWQQIGLLPQFSAREEVSADQPQLQGPETPDLPQAPETEDPPGSSDLPAADAPPEGTGDSDSRRRPFLRQFPVRTPCSSATSARWASASIPASQKRTFSPAPA